MKNKIEKLIENHPIKIILLFQIIISITIFLTRFFKFNKIMVGTTSYFHAIKAEELLTNNFSNITNYHPYQILLSIIDKIFNNIEITSQIVPIILGVVTIFIFFKLLKQLKIDHMHSFTAAILVVLSPIYIYISTVSNQYILSVLILLLAFYLFIRFKESYVVFIMFLIIPFLGIFETVLSIILLLSYLAYFKENKKIRNISIITIVIMFILLFYFPAKNTEIIQNNAFVIKFISGFGAYLGFSIFTLLLTLIGFIFTWKNKRKLIPIYILIVLLFLSFIYIGQYSNIFLNFILCYFSAVALIGLIKYKWNLDTVRDLTIIVLICGLLFTTISYTNRLSKDFPNEEFKSTILKIQKRADQDEIILSDHENGFWIQYFAQRQTVSDLFNINKDVEIIFHSRDYSTVSKLLNKSKVNFIYITPKMKNKIWSSDEEGLLFLLPFKGGFNKVYTKKGYDIWQVVEEDKKRR